MYFGIFLGVLILLIYYDYIERIIIDLIWYVIKKRILNGSEIGDVVF